LSRRKPSLPAVKTYSPGCLTEKAYNKKINVFSYRIINNKNEKVLLKCEEVLKQLKFYVRCKSPPEKNSNILS